MNKTALITGASSGIGRELAKVFAGNGYDLILTARNEKKLGTLKDKLEAKYGIKAFVIIKDLSQKDAAQDVFNEVGKAGLSVDVLVNNAGFGDYKRYADADWWKQFDIVQVNILALMQMTRLFLPQMIQKGDGKILNMASMAAFAPGPFMSVYYASKAFVLSFSEALAAELKGSGVTVTAVCPGPTKTGFEEAAGSGARKLFDTAKRASAKKVALFSYQATMSGKIVAVPGFKYKIAASGQKILPRRAVSAFILKLQGEK
ncbi:MAG: SDR family oxidoreductase [Methanimicrococcus sp.]|nr:SDR family oxidoreductase [Methanimicrococcus sp.]